MRLVLMAGLVGLGLVAPAAACPQPARCIAMISAPSELTSIRAPRTEVAAAAPAKVPYLSLTVRLTDREDGNHPLRRSLISFRPAVVHADDIEIPELWAIVAHQVTDRLPRYEDGEEFSMVLSPVVVTMPTESTPGLGLSGDF
jgi:hypothetical protein